MPQKNEKTFTRGTGECRDKGLARLNFALQLPRPGGVATVLTKHGPEGSGCYSPLISDSLLVSS